MVLRHQQTYGFGSKSNVLGQSIYTNFYLYTRETHWWKLWPAKFAQPACGAWNFPCREDTTWHYNAYTKGTQSDRPMDERGKQKKKHIRTSEYFIFLYKRWMGHPNNEHKQIRCANCRQSCENGTAYVATMLYMRDHDACIILLSCDDWRPM